ncbi:hypothetical protein EVG20_g10672 [Dentipellis fragilis]|uniref:Uncharacterized protein n=1 Tax=Dentipellis fragilis TaxID=205917 RepID=A0A4Y9XPZ2_9AGAM|nr:hypothetical protein EVG20_g10672 [Dentipellis fragilis]
MSPSLTVSYNLRVPEEVQVPGSQAEKTHQYEVKSEKEGYAGYYDELRLAIADVKAKTGDELTVWRDAVGNRELNKEPKSAKNDEDDEEEEGEEEV